MNTSTLTAPSRHAWPVFVAFLRLGLTSFGGPVAHLGYFRDAFVTRRGWLTERAYADLVGLCQFLPGPASSQVGMAIGLSRAGYAGMFAAWLGFTLPSALLMMLFALGMHAAGMPVAAGALHGLRIVSVAVIAQAVWGMARTLCPDTRRATLMAVAACLALLVPAAWLQVAVIVAAGAAGLVLLPQPERGAHDPLPLHVSHRAGALWLVLFAALLVALPFAAGALHSHTLAVADAFFRTGALVFGGGHVVLPLLQAAVVAPGWVGDSAFLAGYGVAQAVPGPLFTFSAFLGASLRDAPNGWLGGTIALVSIFAPSFLLVAGTAPFWERLRRSTRMQAALAGVNAAVVGLLLAALYHPVWSETIVSPRDFAAALVAFVALVFWRVPPWAVVIASAALGWLATALA
ncbi:MULTISPECIES: chromate efflux transporter [unclassified Burkholderia]|uniref:chromate efflux transporter n=1 Tax=unclassified Burkholderia TaxID=2613784 RepID=UPI000F56DCB8|nr:MULTISPECIES: chromate efflux transporter [unclassified Burkholderia]RQR34158.1 chromate transporter [Burkholderia sp. Bp9131]RQR61652.1 chromate transporter [Burkholderia sp. Bp9015]RQR98726.1 chromate transporter [Burkholderia sp. Bp8994]RQS25197.1 chromate transporter [Burkholderia sp. Bp8995]RQS42671.1 chromate transporter [Burkholderia sp. Bp8990]